MVQGICLDIVLKHVDLHVSAERSTLQYWLILTGDLRLDILLWRLKLDINLTVFVGFGLLRLDDKTNCPVICQRFHGLLAQGGVLNLSRRQQVLQLYNCFLSNVHHGHVAEFQRVNFLIKEFISPVLGHFAAN